MSEISTMRLYGSAIAIVSGVYSIGSAMGSDMMPASDLVMLVIGVVVLIHGLVLLTPVADGLGAVSGPLMIAWSVIMLANQVLMGGSIGGGMGLDGGMIAIAILMLASGAMMTWRRSPSDRM